MAHQVFYYAHLQLAPTPLFKFHNKTDSKATVFSPVVHVEFVFKQIIGLICSWHDIFISEQKQGIRRS